MKTNRQHGANRIDNRSPKVSRRALLGGVAAGVAFSVVPRHVLGGQGHTAPSDKISLGLIGLGGQGHVNLFNFLQMTGRVDDDEMYRVFNMGIGMVIMVREQDAQRALGILRKAGERPRIIGRIERGRGDVRMIH